jgi:hypothetical protein
MKRFLREATTLRLLVATMIILAAWCPVPAQAQATLTVAVVTYADIAGNGSAQQIVSSSASHRWCSFVGLSGNPDTIRLGDSNVSASRGLPIAPGGVFNLSQELNLSSWYFYAPSSSDKISVTCGD